MAGEDSKTPPQSRKATLWKRLERGTVERRDRSPAKAVDALYTIFKKSPELETRIAEYSFVQQWGDIVGEGLKDRTRPQKIKNGILFVEVRTSSLAQELSFLKEPILNRLRRMFPQHAGVRDIIFRCAGKFS